MRGWKAGGWTGASDRLTSLQAAAILSVPRRTGPLGSVRRERTDPATISARSGSGAGTDVRSGECLVVP
jgi:hypothetical protein